MPSHVDPQTLTSLTDANPFPELGAWRKSGELVLMVVADAEAETLLSFSFDLNNPAVTISGPAPTISTQGMYPTKDMESAGSGMRPLTVVGAEFDVKRVGQSSPWPCDLNTITVSP